MTDAAMEHALEQALASERKLAVPVALAAALRPAGRPEAANARAERLVALLGWRPDLAAAIHDKLAALIGEAKLVHALAEGGILPDKGFVPVLWDRISDRALPRPLPRNDLRILLHAAFHRPDDWRWVVAIKPELWRALFTAVASPDHTPAPPNRELAAAIVGLAQRVGALGIDEELIARMHEVEDYDSPFLELSHQAWRYLDACEGAPCAEVERRPLLDTIDECRALIERLRARRDRTGTSLRLTGITRRLLQQLRRLELLVHLVRPRGPDDFTSSLVPLFTNLVKTEQRSRSVRRLIAQHADLLAYQVTEHTAKKGAKYITDTARGYWSFLMAAMGGGAIVAVFALVKTFLYQLELSLAAQAFVYSLNYAACFLLIYVTGSILATKQPAVTASAIARRIDEAKDQEGALEGVADMVVLVWRSQTVSFMGNLICAFPIAILLCWGLAAGLDIQVASPKVAAKLLAAIHPLRSGALYYAAVAGVFLFMAGVISGWMDNRVRFTGLRNRLAARWRRWLPAGARERAATLLSDNLGVLLGNVVLGVFLGTAGTIGLILGLPFDIRHIAFSSAHFGVATFSAPELLNLQVVVFSALGVAGIGFVNFLVSFGLTLFTTLESRGVGFSDWRRLGAKLWRRVRERPRDWVLPPAP
jgi:site-specific recombinase